MQVGRRCGGATAPRGDRATGRATGLSWGIPSRSGWGVPTKLTYERLLGSAAAGSVESESSARIDSHPPDGAYFINPRRGSQGSGSARLGLSQKGGLPCLPREDRLERSKATHSRKGGARPAPFPPALGR